MAPRLLIVSSHPIQYQVPWFRALHEDARIQLEVLFLVLPDAKDQGVGFDRSFSWDIPLFDGYKWRLADSARGGIGNGYLGLRTRNARADLLCNNPDAILLTGWQHIGMLQCLRAAVGSGKPVLVRAESNGLKPVGHLAKAKAKLGLSGVRRLLPIGKANCRYYQALGLSRRLGVSVPYFVDNGYFYENSRPLLRARAELRQELGIPETSVCFVFAGKLIKKKHPLAVLRALTIMVNDPSCANVHLLIVGSGRLESALKEYASNYALPVSFAGFLNQSKMPAAYAASDCLVLPSDYGETWGLVVNEAMACGLPAIVSDRVGCGPDLVLEGETGFRFRFDDSGDLVSAMRRVLLLTPEERARLGNNARHLVTQEYSVQQAVNRTVDAVLDVCSESVTQ